MRKVTGFPALIAQGLPKWLVWGQDHLPYSATYTMSSHFSAVGSPRNSTEESADLVLSHVSQTPDRNHGAYWKTKHQNVQKHLQE